MKRFLRRTRTRLLNSPPRRQLRAQDACIHIVLNVCRLNQLALA